MCLLLPDVRRVTSRGNCMIFGANARNGRSAPLMQVVVANLTEQDMVAITEYLPSLPPVKTSRPVTQPSGNATR